MFPRNIVPLKCFCRSWYLVRFYSEVPLCDYVCVFLFIISPVGGEGGCGRAVVVVVVVVLVVAVYGRQAGRHGIGCMHYISRHRRGAFVRKGARSSCTYLQRIPPAVVPGVYIRITYVPIHSKSIT